MRDPVFDDVPAAPSRGAGALVLVAGGLGSVLLGLVGIDVGRYERFAEEAAYWTMGQADLPRHPTAPIALVLVLAALGTSAALAYRRRAEAATLTPALSTALLAFLGGLLHAVMRLRSDVAFGAHPNALYLYLPMAVATTVVPAALALAAASAFRAPAARLAFPLLALPLLMAGLAIAVIASEHPLDERQRVSARVERADRLHEGEAHVWLALVPCLLLLPWIRARPGAALASLAWVGIAASLFAVTRPLAIDAGSAPPRVADDGRTCEPLTGGPLFSLDTLALDGRAIRTPDDLGRDFDTMTRNFAVLHLRAEAPGVLSLTWHGPGSITFTVVRPYLAAALAHGYHRLAVRFDRPRSWRTHTRGVLTRSVQCDRIVQLDDALTTDAPDLVALFSDAGPDRVAVGPIE